MPFEKTRKALIEFDNERPDRDRALDEATTAEDVAAWREAESFALNEVRRAFLEDTKDVNNWSQAQHASLAFMRQCTEKS